MDTPTARPRTRDRWNNFLGNVVQEPLFVATPRSLHDVVTLVRRAELQRFRLRAVGSGRSFSDIAQTTGYLLRPDGLAQVLPIDPSQLRSRADATTLFRVEAGITLERLALELDRAGLALSTMPACAFQTVAGAIATATHGSGVSFGCLSDLVESLTVVGAHGVVYQIEPSDGVTDPRAFEGRNPGVCLMQDDEWFRAAIVSVGCLGIVYSVTLRVQPRFDLEERRWLAPWSRVRGMLREGELLASHRHVEILVDPYWEGGDHQCLVTTRDEARPGSRRTRSYARDTRIWAGSTPLVAKALMATGTRWPGAMRWAVRTGMRCFETPSTIGPSFRVFDLGPPNRLRGWSTEVAVPIEATAEATDDLLEGFRRRYALADYHPSLPFSLRFVRASKAFLAMSSGRDSCFIETPALVGARGAREQLLWVQETLSEHGGRPHWGQLHDLPAGAVDRLYPEIGRFRRVASVLNDSGVFDNAFSDRLELSGPPRSSTRAADAVAVAQMARRATSSEPRVPGAWDRMHRVATDDGCRIALYEYEPVRPRHRHPLLLTHSLSCDAQIWDLHPVGPSFANQLRELGWHVFAIDHRGRGNSDGPTDGRVNWSVDEYILEDLPAAIRHARERSGAERVHLLGHSLGGLLCHLFQIRHGRAEVQSMVTFGSALDYRTRASHLHLIAKLFPLLFLTPNVPIGRLYRALSRWAHLPVWWNNFLYHCDNMRREHASLFATQGMHAIARAEAEQLLCILDERGLRSRDGSLNYTRSAHLSTAPLLAIGGDRDLQCPEDALRWTVEHVGSVDKQLRIFGRPRDRAHYGHMDLLFGIEAPNEIWPFVDRWLEEHDEITASN